MRHLRWVAGFVISGVALWIAFSGVEWRPVGTALAKANVGLLLAAVPVLLILFVIRAQRWRLLFYPDTNITLLSTFGALNVGYMAGNILPLQLGELARTYVLAEAEGLGKIRVLSTIAVERLLDILVLLTFLGLLVPFVDLPKAAVLGAVFILTASLSLAAMIAFAVVDRRGAEQLLDRLSRMLPGRMRETSLRWGEALLSGLSALSNLRVLLYVVSLTVLSWLTSAAVIYMVLRAFSLDVPITAAPFLLVATTLGFFIPSSPGAVGVYDAISIRTLTAVFSVAQEPATSYALVAHALYLLPPTILGAAFFLWHNFSLRRMREWEQADEPGPAKPAPARGATDPAVSSERITLGD